MKLTQQAKSNKERQKASDDRHRAKGHVQRKVWATKEQHKLIKAYLAKLQSN